jgi:hypothetical protein
VNSTDVVAFHFLVLGCLEAGKSHDFHHVYLVLNTFLVTIVSSNNAPIVTSLSPVRIQIHQFREQDPSFFIAKDPEQLPGFFPTTNRKGLDE